MLLLSKYQAIAQLTKLAKYLCILVLLISTITWLYGIPAIKFRPNEFWLYVLIFVIPAGMVCASVIVLVSQTTWRILLGILLLVPSLYIWVGSLVLAAIGFRIH